MSDDRLHNLHLTSSGTTPDGGFHLAVRADDTRSDGVALVFAGMADMLETEAAPNYIEFDLHRGIGKRPVSVCVRWLDRADTTPTAAHRRGTLDAAADRESASPRSHRPGAGPAHLDHRRRWLPAVPDMSAVHPL